MYILHMKNTETIATLQSGAAAVVKRAEAEGVVPVSRHGRTVAFVVSREKMAAILETIELQKCGALMRLVQQDKAGKVHFKEVPDAL